MRNKYKGADIRARLSHTVIRYNSEPYYCEVEGELLRLYTLADRVLTATVESDDPKLDISSLTLGYFNIRGTAVYVSRNPYRRYKQGVELASLLYKNHGKIHVGPDYMLCKGFYDGLTGKYPSNVAAGIREITNNKAEGVALSKDVAIFREKDLFKVFVKGEEAGWMRPGTTQVFVPKTDTSLINVFLIEQISGWTVTEGVK